MEGTDKLWQVWWCGYGSYSEAMDALVEQIVCITVSFWMLVLGYGRCGGGVVEAMVEV